MAKRGYSSRIFLTLALGGAGLSVLLTAGSAHAQSDLRTTIGAKNSIIFDDLAGFRASSIGGVGYSGPLGFTTQNLSEDIPGANVNVTGGSQSFHYTTFWFAPELDYFVIDHLSVGGLVEISTTSSSYSTTIDGTTTTTSQPTTTNVTVLPRIGWMFPVSERWAIWPRLGLGYAVRSTAEPAAANGGGIQTNSTDSVGAFVMDLDASFIYRVNQVFFLRATPEITLAPGSHTITNNNVSTSYGATLFAFTADVGIGINWQL